MIGCDCDELCVNIVVFVTEEGWTNGGGGEGDAAAAASSAAATGGGAQAGLVPVADLHVD